MSHLGFEIFVTAVEVVDTADGRFAFGDEACEYEGCAGAEVGTHDVCAFEREAALDGCRVAVQLDGGSQTFEFCDVLEAVVIDGILHETVAGNGEERCHERSLHVCPDGERLFEKVLKTSQQWGTDEQMMYVVGATQGQMFEDIRRLAPNHFLLVPGVGAQGGSLQEVCKYGMTKDCGLLVNSSRGIIYASQGEDFAEVAAEKARELQQQMAAELAKL